MVAPLNKDEWWRKRQEAAEIKVTRKVAQLSSEANDAQKSETHPSDTRDRQCPYS